MPSDVVSLALACSIYPPALAVVIALGRGPDVRLRVVLFVVGAFFTVLVTGSLMLLLFAEVTRTIRPTLTVGAWLYLVAGAALIWLAIALRRHSPEAPRTKAVPSKTGRYLQSTVLVLALGVILYVVPSPIYVGLVKAIADTHASTARQLGYLVQALLIMLWMIELPMLLLLAFPVHGSHLLEDVNAWFAKRGRPLAVLAAAGVGSYLIGVGLVELL